MQKHSVPSMHTHSLSTPFRFPALQIATHGCGKIRRARRARSIAARIFLFASRVPTARQIWSFGLVLGTASGRCVDVFVCLGNKENKDKKATMNTESEPQKRLAECFIRCGASNNPYNKREISNTVPRWRRWKDYLPRVQCRLWHLHYLHTTNRSGWQR